MNVDQITEQIKYNFDKLYKNKKTSNGIKWTQFSNDIIEKITDIMFYKHCMQFTISTFVNSDFNITNIPSNLLLNDLKKIVKQLIIMLNYAYYNYIQLEWSEYGDTLYIQVNKANTTDNSIYFPLNYNTQPPMTEELKQHFSNVLDDEITLFETTLELHNMIFNN